MQGASQSCPPSQQVWKYSWGTPMEVTCIHALTHFLWGMIFFSLLPLHDNTLPSASRVEASVRTRLEPWCKQTRKNSRLKESARSASLHVCSDSWLSNMRSPRRAEIVQSRQRVGRITKHQRFTLKTQQPFDLFLSLSLHPFHNKSSIDTSLYSITFSRLLLAISPSLWQRIVTRSLYLTTFSRLLFALYLHPLHNKSSIVHFTTFWPSLPSFSIPLTTNPQ